MIANFHELQRRSYQRRIEQRIREALACLRPARRRWLVGEIKRLRSRADWHASRVAELCSPAVQALVAEHKFYARRGRTRSNRMQREEALDRARDALIRAGHQYAAEKQTAAQGRPRGNQ